MASSFHMPTHLSALWAQSVTTREFEECNSIKYHWYYQLACLWRSIRYHTWILANRYQIRVKIFLTSEIKQLINLQLYLNSRISFRQPWTCTHRWRSERGKKYVRRKCLTYSGGDRIKCNRHKNDFKRDENSLFNFWKHFVTPTFYAIKRMWHAYLTCDMINFCLRGKPM